MEEITLSDSVKFLVDVGVEEAIAECAAERFGSVRMTELTKRAVKKAAAYGAALDKKPWNETDDRAMLSTVLGYIVPNADINVVTAELLEKHKSLLGVLAAGREATMALGYGDGVAMRLKLLLLILLWQGRHIRVPNFNAACELFQNTYLGGKIENCAFAVLDSDYAISYIGQCDGREPDDKVIAAAANDTGCSRVIIARRASFPTERDKNAAQTVRELRGRLAASGVELIDMLLIFSDTCASLGASAFSAQPKFTI